jgi:two-component system chemotaxis sensor kinase CheA
MDLSRYAELFLTEAQEHLQTINESLLELETQGFEPAAIDKFFRAVHTIKGMSATMGYTAVAQLSHDMESLLAEVRDGSRGLDGTLLDVLFHSTDVLQAAIEACAAGRQDDVNVTTALSALSDLRNGEGKQESVDRNGRARMMRTGEFAAATGTGAALRVEVRLRADTQLPGVRAFVIISRLRALGEIVALQPPEGDIQSGTFDGSFIAALDTSAGADAVRELVMSSGDVEAVSVGEDVPLAAAPSPEPRSPESQSAQSAQSAQPAQPAKLQPAPSRPASAASKSAAPKHVRVEQRRLDALMNLVGELVIARGRLLRRSDELHDPELEQSLASMSRQITELQEEIMASRMVPVWQVFDRFPRMVRDAARNLNKKVDFVMEGRDIELDRSLLDEIGDPIVHLLRNAVDHGIELPDARLAAGKPETGRLVLSAARDREAVLFRVTDDGKGIDREKIARKAREMSLLGGDSASLTDEQLFTVIATSGFSTADAVTDISGRGVGVDAVVTRVRSMGGSVELKTAAGEGTTISIRLPLTLAIIRAMLARAGDETYALPLTNVAETVEVDVTAFRTVRGRPVTILRDEVLPLIRLRDVVRLPAAPDEKRQLVVLEVARKRAGLIVDDLLGQQEIVVKQFDAVRGGEALFSGATILGNGELALIVDVGTLI